MADEWAEFRVQPSQPAQADEWTNFRQKPRDEAAVQAEFDAAPWYGKLGQALDDTARLFANGVTFGYADKLAGATGDGTEAERAKSEEARVRAGSAGTAAEIGGAVATPTLLGRAGLSLPGVASSLSGVTGAAARTGLAGIEGAGYGMLDASGNDRDLADGALLGAIFGAGGQAAGEAVRGGIGRIAEQFNAKPAIPALTEIEQSAKAAYDAADNAGVIYTPQALDRLRTDVVSKLTDLGYDPALQPGAAAALKRIEDLAGQNVTFKGLDTLRKVASNGYVQGNASNNKAISQIISVLDDIVTNAQPGEVMTGNAQAASDAVRTARDMWSRLAKADTIGEAVKRGELNAATSGTGWNTENALRQAMKGVAVDKTATRGFTPDELEALRGAAEGTLDQNALRLIGRLAPTGVISGGVGVGGGHALGTALGGPEAAMAGAMAVPAVGFGARTMATNTEAKQISDLVDIIFAGGSKQAVTPTPNAVQDFVSANGNDLLRAIFGGSQFAAGDANERLHKPQGGR